MRRPPIEHMGALRLAAAIPTRAMHPIERKRVATARTPQETWNPDRSARFIIRAGFFPLTRLNTLLPREGSARGGPLRAYAVHNRRIDIHEV
jgi:hypothetical protein